MLGSWKCNALLVAQVEAQRTGVVIGGSQVLVVVARAAQNRPVLGVAVSVGDQGVQHEIASEDGKGIELGRPREAGWGPYPRSTCRMLSGVCPRAALSLGSC